MWRKVFVRTGFAQRGSTRAGDGQAAAVELGHLAPLARDRGVIRLPCPALRSPLRLAVQASVRPRHRKRRRAVTRDVLHPLLATCASDRLADTRDVAILIVAFPSGGPRCSEAAGLRVERLREGPSVQKHRTLVGRIEA
jgi:integrase